MDVFEEFLTNLLREGRVVFKSRPIPARRASPASVKVAEGAFRAYRLEVAGPPIAFNPSVACESAELVRQACWALVNRADTAEDLASVIRMGSRPIRPSDHLSADLFLRYLPRVYRRARAADASDPLVGLIRDVLRRWPLSRALFSFEDQESETPDLGGHPGLMLLYAERLSVHQRQDLVPSGVAGEFVQLVRQVVRPRSTDEGGWNGGSWNG